MIKKIMICDDDPGILDMMVFALETSDRSVITEIDSLKVIGDLRREKPDLLLLDLWMPVLSGDHVLRQLKNDPELKNLPVIVMSASRDGEGIARAAGADDYLPKPFDIADLMDKVNQRLNQPNMNN